MLRCCTSYGKRLPEGMEGTQALQIQASDHSLTESKRVKCLDPPVKIRKERSLETIDNRELESIAAKGVDDKIRHVASDEDDDEDVEKIDSSKEEHSKTEDGFHLTSGKGQHDAASDEVSCSDDDSVDNNTFNIINTENSESQEVSDLTNDDSHKENDDHARENGESDRGTQTDEDSEDELSCLEEEDDEELEDEEDECDMTDETGDSDVDDLSSASDGGDESDDEREFDHDSLEDEKHQRGKSHLSSSTSSSSVAKALPAAPPPPPAAPAGGGSVVAGVKTCDLRQLGSPKVRQRLRSFGKKDKGDFKIEIYESKRKPTDVPTISVDLDVKKTGCVAGETCVSRGEGKEANEAVNQHIRTDALPAQVDVSPCSDITTPDSADNTLGLTLDVSQAIREETDESDRFSPLRSPLADNKKTANVHNTKDPTCKSGGGGAITSSQATQHLTSSSSTSTTTATTTTTTSSGSTSGGEPPPGDNHGREVSPPEAKKPTPMAFTIELGGGSGSGDLTSSSSSSSGKKLDISASISKWAPKHRRNLSLTKVEEHKKVEERGGKPPVGRPRSGTIGATGLQQGRRGGGYHSEGYFSSDQDDEGPRRTELKSPRSPRTPELRSPQTPQRLVRSASQDSAKGASLRMRTPSPDNASRSSHIMTLNESASYLIEKMMNNTPEAQRKQGSKTEGRTCCKADKKPTIAEVTGRTKSEKSNKQSTVKMTPEGRKQSNSANSLSSCQTYDVKQDRESEGGKEEKDDVSEAGTYTIEKDSSSPEVEQARNDIDRVFGVSGTESEVDVTVVTPRGNAPTEDLWTPTPEQEKFKSPGSISRSSPNWIRQWAAQVAEHTKSSDVSVKTSLGSPRGSKPPLASLSSSQESSESRPRRKLPTPPTHHPPFTMVSPKASDLSDHESPTKGQARVDMNKGISTRLRGTSFESHDSGGDSDLDTSTSYPINDDDDRLMKTVGSQLKTRLKLAGIDGSSKTPPVATSPRKPDPLAVETRLKLTSHFKRERSIVSDSGYDMYTAGKEENNLQSDSSSEASEPVKDSRKTSDNNPPLKFNRAFSLRRARLASEEATQQHKSPSPVDKKKITRPSSAGNVSGSRKIPLSQSKSHQGVHTVSRSGSHSQATTPKSGSNDFSRGDGGRFSLRLPSAGLSTTISKSPSRTSVKKELPSSRRGAPRSNSTLSAKEVDFQNWKRRKNYDPMKAAAEGRKKVGDKKSDKLSQGNAHNTNERSPSPPGSLLRSASFHGTEGMGVAGRWPRRPNHLYTSEDDGPCSLEEEQPHPVPHCSPLRRSPTSPHQLSSPHTTSPARQGTLSSARARRASYALSDEGEGHVGSPRKTSLDESGSEGKRSPLGSTRGIVSGRSKAKMEALDNLVISTIHSLSVKVRTTSETLLQKLKSQYDEEGDRAALLEEVLAHLSESDQTLTSGQSRSTSRELAGILRNLKKIEHALEVIDRVMVCVDDDDLDEDDLDGTTGHEWGGSDY